MNSAAEANTTTAHRYPSLVAFYNADPRRVHSREQDVGLWWRDGADGALHRAAWISETGELYLVRLGPAAEGGGSVEILARVSDARRLEWLLSGWRERCGGVDSLRWLRRRLARPPKGAARSTPRPPRRAPHAPLGAAA
jgi:hypothetical protein